MRHPSPQLPSKSPRSPAAHSGGAWEELPSLADSLSERLVVLGTRHRDALSAARSRASVYEQVARSGRHWDPTCPADLEPARPPVPFVEPVSGVAVRELEEPELLRHFFGPLSRL